MCTSQLQGVNLHCGVFICYFFLWTEACVNNVLCEPLRGKLLRTCKTGYDFLEGIYAIKQLKLFMKAALHSVMTTYEKTLYERIMIWATTSLHGSTVHFWLIECVLITYQRSAEKLLTKNNANEVPEFCHMCVLLRTAQFFMKHMWWPWH